MDWFDVALGIKHGCVLSFLLFGVTTDFKPQTHGVETEILGVDGVLEELDFVFEIRAHG